jgi:hypothetical protein
VLADVLVVVVVAIAHGSSARLVEYTGRREEVRSGAPRAALPPRGRAGNMKSTKEENMHKSLGILVTGLLVSASCLAQGSLVGTYKLVSIKAEIDGKLRDDRTKPPHGYLMITPKYYAVFYTRQDRKFGTSDADKAALWESLTAFAGLYRIEGKKIVISPDVSYNEIFNGTQQTRDIEVNGRGITLSSGPRPYGRDPSKKIVLRQEWERIESVNCHPM